MSPVERIVLAPAGDKLENSIVLINRSPFFSALSLGKPTLQFSIVAKVRSHQ